jgi:Protein of unknown function (DUF3443)
LPSQQHQQLSDDRRHLPEDDLASLRANGILGVGIFAQDCGSACTTRGASNPGVYYTCPASGCQVTTESLSDQVQNPVPLFAADNNGVIIELPSVSGEETNVSGLYVVVLAVQLHQLGRKVGADLGEDMPECLDSLAINEASAVFGHEDQMNMHCKHTVSTVRLGTPFLLWPKCIYGN